MRREARAVERRRGQGADEERKTGREKKTKAQIAVSYWKVSQLHHLPLKVCCFDWGPYSSSKILTVIIFI